MSALEVFPPALPLDGAEVLIVAWWMTDPLVQAWVAFSLFVLMLAFLAALGFARSIPKPRYRRTPERQEGVASTPEVSAAPFPNLLAQK
jgi:Zn-dependent protease